MFRRFWLIIAAAVLISGCTATPQPKFQFPADTRIGVINRLEGYATHQSFSSLRIGSFSKKLNTNWQMPVYFEEKLTRILQNDTRYSVIPIRPAEASGGIDQQLDRIDEISMSDKIKPDVADLLKTLADKHNLDVIIVIKSFRGPSAFKIDKHPYEAAEVLNCTSVQPAGLHKKFSPKMRNVFINLFCKMFQKLVHFAAFMLHDLFSDV
jgi:hypothetical protein